ncbi:hypothetical protein M404DRAFT_36493 [Pisolithus tinctorius Marx 270]|uniref:Uncharacterized protein n=1 Tax=Pisolithus tinctorius Marx 270 TaxID=870435 RepID=A0A0C3NBQ5_PISTI|nr:hypothetical protein M404DRAFT_36493 [Pisolithus tinctorius Marx 270]
MSMRRPRKPDPTSDSSESDSDQSDSAQTSSRHHHNGKINKSKTKSKKSRDCAVSTPRDQCLHAARWIPRAFDMYCNLNEVIQVSRALEADDTASGPQ